MLVDIDKIKVGDRIRKDFGDVQELADDIRENTLLNALVVTPDGGGTYLLIAGERRLKACKLLGYKAVPVNSVGVDDAEQALLMEISENECRKEFTKTERLEYARRLARIESAKAKERMEAGKAQDPTENSPQGETREIVAKQLGTSSNTIAREQYISDNRDLLDPADFADWDEGRLSTNKAYQRVKAAQAEAIRERDQARRELEDAYRAGEAMEAEAASLRRQLAERPKPEVEVREVEVVPEDYAEMQRRVRELEHYNRLYMDSDKRMRRQIKEQSDEIHRMRDVHGFGFDGSHHDAQSDIRQLTVATNAYLRNYGGKVWAFDEFQDIGEDAREEFAKAITNLAAFSQNLVRAISDKSRTKGLGTGNE